MIDNKPGANGNLGAEFVARAQPDGYTWLLCDLGALAISPSIYTKLSFDPSKDLRGAAMLAYSPHMLVVHPSVQANNLQEPGGPVQEAGPELCRHGHRQRAASGRCRAWPG